MAEPLDFVKKHILKVFFFAGSGTVWLLFDNKRCLSFNLHRAVAHPKRFVADLSVWMLRMYNQNIGLTALTAKDAEGFLEWLPDVWVTVAGCSPTILYADNYEFLNEVPKIMLVRAITEIAEIVKAGGKNND